MENAIWNGKNLLASEISKDYFFEKEIRKASGRKELQCPDSECQHPTLRYCHGEKKDAYFAHLNNTTCDYAIFDSENTQVMRRVRNTLFENFMNRGYSVQQEIKILPHHYTHLLFSSFAGQKIAVEIGTQRLSANKIDALTEEYGKNNLSVKWVVVSSTGTLVRETQTFFLKRYLLNESVNNDLIVVNWDCEEVAQFKVDPNEYQSNGLPVHLKDYPETYSEYGILDDIVFEGDELTFAGFQGRYKEWLDSKRNACNKEIEAREDRRRKTFEKRVKQYNIKAQNRQIENSKKHDKYKDEVLERVGDRMKAAQDSLGRSWAICELCGHVDTVDKFWTRQGGIGKCVYCEKKNKTI